MKVFISADIEGVNNIQSWAETEKGDDYEYFRKQMTDEVREACIAAHEAGATEIIVKDAHNNARNLILKDLPEYVKLHRGWQGCPGSMMAGIDETFDACLFIGYHSPSRSDGNPLSHTMTLSIHHIKINGEIASEFYLNALTASYYHVPTVFVSGDKNLTELIKKENENITTVATKEGVHGAVISNHPLVTDALIHKKVKEALTNKNLKSCLVEMPRNFDVEIQYKNPVDAYSNSFYPGCKLVGSVRVIFNTDDWYEVLRMIKFTL